MIGADAYPWLNDPQVPYAWVADNRWLVVGIDGVTQWNAQKGNVPFLVVSGTVPSEPTFEPAGWGAKARGSLLFTSTVGTRADFMKANAIAPLIAGLAQPWTQIISHQFTSLAGFAGFPPFEGFATQAQLHQGYDAWGPFGGKYRTQRVDDTGTVVTNTTTENANLNRRVITLIFNGTTRTIRLDGVVTSVNGEACNVGVMTPDNFDVAALSAGGNLYQEQIRHRTRLFAPFVMDMSSIVTAENFLLRELA